MADAVYKKIEVVGTSNESFSAAAAVAVHKARESEGGDMRWFEVVEQRGRIVDGEVHEYQVTLRIGLRLE